MSAASLARRRARCLVMRSEVCGKIVEEQDMGPLDPEERKLVLDYLATHFGRDS